MKHKEFKNNSLIEAQVEIRWGQADQSGSGIKTDPYYKMTLGRFYERVMETYPVHEILPASKFPETMVYHTAQHLFRVGNGKWPAIQIGPGILSVHTREEYLWEDLATKAQDALSQLLDAYPKMVEMRIEMIRLHYIDAVNLDFNRENVLQFLHEKFKTNIELPPSLFLDGHVSSRPKSFSWEATFEEDQPEGSITIRFSTGERDARPALLWETIVESSGRQLPPLPSGMGHWLNQAHALTEDWFIKFIEGDLERDFAGA